MNTTGPFNRASFQTGALTRNGAPQAKQGGAALIVSLILLLVLTVVGLSAVENVALQSKMARNSEFKVQTYQIALSEIAAQQTQLAVDLAPLDTALDDGSLVQTGDDIVMQPGDVTQTVSFDYVGTGVPPEGYSIDEFVGRHFELNSRAQMDNTGIFSDQTQGLNYAGPK